MSYQVATWRAGSDHWSYDPEPSVSTHKASLDPYRLESKRILAIFEEVCPNAHTERASIDESFLDLSKDVYDLLLRRYPCLRITPGVSESEHIPLPQLKSLDWGSCHLVSNDAVSDEDPDWDDVAMSLGAEIVKGLRDAVKTRLGYTCSAGIAGNKMIAKLGSGYKKPDQQSVVRSSAVQTFLNAFPFIKIRNLGGKLGDRISEHFHTTSLPELLKVTLAQFQGFLDDGSATWVYNTIRGIDRSVVEPKGGLKSMLSTKSFRDPLPRSFSMAQEWLRVFVSELAMRIHDEGGRRPKSMLLGFRPKGGAGRSRQIAVPSGAKVDADVLLKMAEGLLRQLTDGDTKAWPCISMTLQLAGMEDTEEGVQGIMGFLVKGEGAMTTKRKVEEESTDPVEKRLKMILPVGISEKNVKKEEGVGRSPAATSASTDTGWEQSRNPDTVFRCDRCGADMPITEEDEHNDWHFAKELEQADRAVPPPPSAPRPPQPKKKLPKKGERVEKGQMKLPFG
jgi:DNA polymerase eta